jgi:hypothetical protein
MRRRSQSVRRTSQTRSTRLPDPDSRERTEFRNVPDRTDGNYDHLNELLADDYCPTCGTSVMASYHPPHNAADLNSAKQEGE